MANLSRSQEREERRKMSRGVTTSVVALLLCWVPVLGLLLAAIGFIGVVRCITERYRKQFAASVAAVSVILVVCAGMLTFEVYAYSRDPDIIQNTGSWLLETLTGEYMDDYNYLGGEDYSDMDYPGLGMDENLFGDGYFDADGNFVPYESDTMGEPAALEDGAVA